MGDMRRYTPGHSATRRSFLRQGLGAACFVVPLFRNGGLGQPVPAPGPWFVDLA